MMLDDNHIKELVWRLKTGQMGMEHSPPAVAAVIERLWIAKLHAETELRDLESVATTTQTQGLARNTYAMGYRDAIEAAQAILPVDEAVMLSSLAPDLRRANIAARMN